MQLDLFAQGEPILPTVAELVARGALFVVNHSGGKDSQALLIDMARRVPLSQIVVVHASLGEVEWHGALEHAQAQTEALGLPFIVARAEKSFLDMVERRFATRPELFARYVALEERTGYTMHMSRKSLRELMA